MVDDNIKKSEKEIVDAVIQEARDRFHRKIIQSVEVRFCKRVPQNAEGYASKTKRFVTIAKGRTLFNTIKPDDEAFQPYFRALLTHEFAHICQYDRDYLRYCRPLSVARDYMELDEKEILADLEMLLRGGIKDIFFSVDKNLKWSSSYYSYMSKGDPIVDKILDRMNVESAILDMMKVESVMDGLDYWPKIFYSEIIEQDWRALTGLSNIDTPITYTDYQINKILTQKKQGTHLWRCWNNGYFNYTRETKKTSPNSFDDGILSNRVPMEENLENNDDFPDDKNRTSIESLPNNGKSLGDD